MTDSGISVRPAEDEDAERIADVFAGYVLASIATFVEEPPPASAWRERLAAARDHKLPFLVAELADIATLPDARHDTPSIVLHRRLGFEVVGRMPAVGHKQGQWVDTVLMQKDLRPGS